jgi:hypothetical protein
MKRMQFSVFSPVSRQPSAVTCQPSAVSFEITGRQHRFTSVVLSISARRSAGFSREEERYSSSKLTADS